MACLIVAGQGLNEVTEYSNYLQNVETGDETCIYDYDIERKDQ